MRRRPIAVFDSGLGGLSVLRALRAELPHEDFLYFGDCGNAPYGSRPTDEIRRLTLGHAERLLGCAKALVVACNTATSAAIDDLRTRYPNRVIIGIEPALKPALLAAPNGRILVMATEATLRERKFAALTAQYADRAEIIKCPCPELVAFVERGELSGEALAGVLRRELADACRVPPDAVVLGCTHFPFLRAAIDDVLGGNIRFFDGAAGTARETRRRLTECDLLRPDGNAGKWYLQTGGPRDMTPLAEHLMGEKPHKYPDTDPE